ncbi:hypothetical protein MUK42_08148 [Musa troglodytarum]|uniref:Uncharacterized protein n=1 Tax=Musa troglodytarum TaxID=320322 RepID=A0A9E7JD97_9LILI|nr:hypothetical protein MUK42_08148 [Musa troglodytarum]
MAAAVATADPRDRHPPGRRVDDKNLVLEASPGVEALRLRVREAIRDPAAGRGPHHPRPRRHRPGTVRYRKVLDDRPLRLPDGRRHLQRV